jgi:PhnB protein
MGKDKLTLNLVVPDALAAMEFYEKAFDAIRGEVYRFPNRKGVNETNVTLGGVSLRLIDENADYSCFSPKKGEVDSIWLQIEVSDTDETLKKAVSCGATVGQEPSEFMGVRYAEITDPFGYVWTVNQILREVTFEERYRFYEESHLETDKKKAESGAALPDASEPVDGKTGE